MERDDGVTVPAPMYILSFDAIIKDAEARNYTFLEILKGAFRKAKSEPAKG